MSMSGIDHSLVEEVRKHITGANVHRVKTWILCYSLSVPRSKSREKYEKLLRQFLASKKEAQAVDVRTKRIV